MEPLELEIQQGVRMPFDFKLLALININLLTNAATSYVLPFYPDLAFKQAHMNYSIIGILMSIKSIGALLAAFQFGSKIQIYGRKRFLIITLTSQALIMLLYASLYFLTSHYYVFLGISGIIRVLEGVMRSIQSVISMAYLNIFYPDTFAKKFSLMESMSSFGQIIGPVIGSLLHHYFGYWIPLVCLGILLQLCVLLVYYVIPSDTYLPHQGIAAKKKLPLLYALSQKSVAIIFAALVASRATVIYFNSFFTNHMASYNLTVDESAIMLSVPSVSYTLLILICSRVFTNRDSFRVIFSVSLLVNFVGAAIMSPVWPDFGDIHHIWIGLVLIALGGAMNRMPSIPVIAQTLEKTRLQLQNPQELTDMGSALLQMTLSASNLLFPSFGGIIYTLFGGGEDDKAGEEEAFRCTMLVLVFIQILMFTIDMLFNGGCAAWRDYMHRKQKIEHEKFTKTSEEGAEQTRSDENGQENPDNNASL